MVFNSIVDIETQKSGDIVRYCWGTLDKLQWCTETEIMPDSSISVRKTVGHTIFFPVACVYNYIEEIPLLEVKVTNTIGV